ncbi:MAG: hypothetical protein JNM67_00310 [Bacteroidetes bacterium]|nr:hypothetical protein [Bacteroidota bacterium]
MTKFYLPFLIALFSISSQSTLLNIPKLKNKLSSDSGDLISANSKQILDYLRRKHAESKKNCFEKNDLEVHKEKLLLFAHIDTFYRRRNEFKRSDYPKFTLSAYLNLNTKLKENELFRIKYFSLLDRIPCYDISIWDNFQFDAFKNDTCLLYLKRKLQDYVLIELYQVVGEIVMDELPKNSLSESYHCVSNMRAFGILHDFEKSFFMFYSKNEYKPHLILGDDFCQSANDWKTLYSLLMDDEKVSSDSTLKESVLTFYVKMFVRETFDAAWNPQVKIENLKINPKDSIATAVAKNIGYRQSIRSYNVPRKDFFLTINLNTGIISYKL